MSRLSDSILITNLANWSITCLNTATSTSALRDNDNCHENIAFNRLPALQSTPSQDVLLFRSLAANPLSTTALL
jgi:hypothetical protein